MGSKNPSDQEEFHRILFEEAADSIFITDCHGRHIAANQRCTELTGFSHNELLNMSVRELIPPEDLIRDPIHIGELRQGKIVTHERRIQRKDHTLLTVEISTRMLPEGNLLCIVRDITARKQAEAMSAQRARELAALHALGLAVSASLSMDQTLAAALRGMMNAVQPDLAVLFLREGERLMLHEVLPREARQRLGSVPEHRMGECICGLAVQEGRPLYSRNIFTDSRCTWEECKRAGLRSFVALPLRSEKEIFGVIGLASLTERDFEGQADFLETLTQQISMALANARLYEAAQRELADRKRAEETLQKKERGYRELVENANSIILRWNPCGEITFLNEFGQKFFGYSEDELLGRNVVGTITPDTESTGRDLRTLMQDICDDPAAFEQNVNENMLRDGRRVWISWTNKTVFDGEGNLVEVLSIGTDITDRKRAEEVLLKNARLLRKAEEVARFGSWEFLLAENKIHASDEARAIYGLGTQEWSISNVQHIPLPEYRPMLDRALKDLIERRTPYNLEFKIRRPADGKIVDIHSIAEYDAAENVVFGVIQDITDRIRAEAEQEKLQAQLLQAQKMESVGRLAGGVAHDFNNMLSAILGHAELAMMQVDPADPIHANLKEIQGAAHRSADLTRQLLGFARKQTVAPQVLDLNNTVSGMLKMLLRLIGEDIDLVWNPGAGLWPVKIDPSQVDQLLANLCVNARDAIVGVGKLTIETENIAFDDAYCAAHPGYVCGEYVLLAVSDNGHGMSKEVQKHLFEPFYTTKEAGKGTGLGLATVYGIVKQNEGFINVYSEPDKGSTFKIYLPRFEGEAAGPARETTHATTKGRGELVLLVEDEVVILDMCKAMLEELGYAVLTARTPGEALRQAKANASEILLLITDVIMPEMNGRDLARMIRDIKPGLKCLFTSGYTANVIAHHGVLDDGVNFLQKPYSMQDLAVTMRKVLERE